MKYTPARRAVEARSLAAVNRYNAAAVDAAIASSNRAGRKVSRREGKLIQALLKGRTDA
jgi:hypothetical protein